MDKFLVRGCNCEIFTYDFKDKYFGKHPKMYKAKGRNTYPYIYFNHVKQMFHEFKDTDIVNHY